MKNPYIVDGETTKIIGKSIGEQVEILIDTKDLPLVSSFKNTWHIKKDRLLMYAYGQTWVGRKSTMIKLHRFITGAHDGLVIDHINGNGLDNRRENLREVKQYINSHNKRVSENSISGVNGVSWYKAYSKWRARVMLQYKEHHLGYFDDMNDAINAVKKFKLEHDLYSRGLK